MNFDCSEVQMKRCTLFRLGGRLDASCAADLQKELDAVTDGTGFFKKDFHLVIDLKNVTYLSSAVMNVLAATLKKCRKYNRGDVRLSGVTSFIKRMMYLKGISGSFQFFDTEAKAVGSF